MSAWVRCDYCDKFTRASGSFYIKVTRVNAFNNDGITHFCDEACLLGSWRPVWTREDRKDYRKAQRKLGVS